MKCLQYETGTVSFSFSSSNKASIITKPQVLLINDAHVVHVDWWHIRCLQVRACYDYALCVFVPQSLQLEDDLSN